MTRTTTRLALTALAAAALAATAFAEVNANIEFDNTLQNNSRGLSQGGRVELNAIGKGVGTGNAYVAGKASFLALRNGNTAVDDLWVQLGNDAGDLKLGRFEAADVYRRGRDTIVDVAGSGYTYRANILRGRTGSSGNSPFQAAANVVLGGGLGAELGVIEGKSGASGAFDASTDGASPYIGKGVRPALYYKGDNGFSAIASIESGKVLTPTATDASATSKLSGFGASVGIPVAGATLTLNGATGKIEGKASRSHTAGLTAAVGPIEAAFESGKSFNAEKINTVYASYQTGLFDIKGATITPALSYSKVKDAAAGTPDKNTSLRVRFNYAF